MERRFLDWLFAPGAWGNTAALFFLSALVVAFLPLSDDGKLETMRRVLPVLAVLHFFMMRSAILMCLLEVALSVLSVIAQYVLSAVVFALAAHAFANAGMDSGWLQLGARLAGAFYTWSGLDIVHAYGDENTSSLKTLWLSWLMTPLLARRLLVRRARLRIEELRTGFDASAK